MQEQNNQQEGQQVVKRYVYKFQQILLVRQQEQLQGAGPRDKDISPDQLHLKR